MLFKPGQPVVSISLALVLLLLSLCQCGNGTDDEDNNSGIIDKSSGNKSSQSSPSPPASVVGISTYSITSVAAPAAESSTSTSVNVISSDIPTATFTTTNTSSITTTPTVISVNSIASVSESISNSTETLITTDIISRSSETTTVPSESKLFPTSNDDSSSSSSSRPPFQLRRATQLKNDNETTVTTTKGLQSTQQPSSSSSSSSSSIIFSTATVKTFTNASTLFPPTSSSAPFTTSTATTSIHHSDDFATSIKSQQQQQHLQQRSKLWAPHSNVADFLKGMDDDVGPANSTQSHYAKSSGSSSSSSSLRSNTNLGGEKVGQQTRSIRSIRLIANNNNGTSSSSSSSSNGGGFVISNGNNNNINNNSPAKKIISSSFRHHHKQERQQARGEYAVGKEDAGRKKSSNVDGIIVTGEDDDDDEEEDDEDNVAVFHVNNNKFPVISSIRHYRSRKSFSRTRKSTNPSGADVYGSKTGDGRVTGYGDAMITTANMRDRFNYDSATIANLPSDRYEKAGARRNPVKSIKSFSSQLSISRQTMKDADDVDDDEVNDDKRKEQRDDAQEEDGDQDAKTIYEIPQGDAPHTEQEKEDDETAAAARSRYYYGQVATRKMHGQNSDEASYGDGGGSGGTPRGSSSISGDGGSRSLLLSSRGEHYGKIIDKPVMLRGDGHIITASNEGQKSGYSSTDDTAPAALYENSYFIPKEVSSSTEATDGDGGTVVAGERGNRKRPSALSSSKKNGLHHERLFEDDKNSTILQRINKTFLSRTSKSRQQQHQKQQQHLEVNGSEGNGKHDFPSILNADLLVNKSPDLNHWSPNSPDATRNAGDDSSNTLVGESGKGWEKKKSDDSGHNGKGTSIRLPSGDSSKGINNYFSPQSTLTTSGTSINTSTSHWNPSSSSNRSHAFFEANNRNRARDERVKLKGTLNDSDYAIVESGKAHSSQEGLLLPSPSNAFSNERSAGVSPTKQSARNRSGQLKPRRKQQQQQQQNSKRPTSGVAAVPNDHHHHDENESGSLSERNNFHTLQGLNSYAHQNLESKDAKLEEEHGHKFDNVAEFDSTNEGYPYKSSGRKEGQSREQIRQRAGQRSSYSSSATAGVGSEQIVWENSLSTGSDRRDKSGKRKLHDDKVGFSTRNEKDTATPTTTSIGSSSIKRNQEMRSEGKSDNEELKKGKKSNVMELEYFPRVESFSSDSAYGDSSNDLFDEYKPPGPEYYGGDSGDLLLYDGDASPLSETSPSSSSSSAQRNKPDSDIVTRFLNIVESQHLLGENCTAGTDFNLGEGVVDRYAQERFRLEAEFAVNRANMLTRMWKYVNQTVLHNEYLLHAMVMSMVEFDDDIFAAGNCYDQLQYKNYTLFCPFAFRYDGGTVLVKDLSLEYHYLSNSSEWFFIARKNAEKIVQAYNQFNRGYHQFRINETSMTDPIPDEVLNVTYEDGKWSKPYFDCGGANIWMITYTVPFFGYDNTTGKYFFKGTSGIDIDLRRVDIDQCPLPDNSTDLNIFASSDKCKNATTMCAPIMGLGFRRGSYRCVCKEGFYFPNVTSPHKYYNGTVVEEEYEKKFDSNDTSYYDVEGAFECLRCPDGCDSCVDDRPCVVSLNWLMRSAILILQCSIILMLPIVGLFTFKYSDVKVVRAASPVLLRFIVLGAFFIYCTILVMYPSPSVITCTLRVWLREIGFSLAYGALMLKTWRISVIFRVRSAKAIKITDLDLMKRLGIIVAMFTALLVIRTLVAPPAAIVSLTADDLKAWLCKTDWWDHSFTLIQKRRHFKGIGINVYLPKVELSFLVWGIRLCIVVRKAPSEFNESKFISLAIYNEFLLSLFLNISMLFLQSPANPDLLYIIFFCHVQLTMTLLLCLIFGSKAYMVFRGQGKGSADESSRMPTSKFISKGRPGQGNKQLSAHNSTGLHSSTTSTGPTDPNYNSRLSEDVQEEFRRLYAQLEELKERNMRLGNRHLVAKIAAMQEAADNILQAPANQTNGQSHTLIQQQLHQLSPGSNSSGINNGSGGGGSGAPGSLSASPSSSSGHSPHTKGKSPSAFGPLSDISEEENPLQSLSGQRVQSPGGRGPKVLETSIDIVIQNDSSRKTATELGDNEQENNLNNGFHPLAQGLKSLEEGGRQTEDLRNTISEDLTRNKDGVVVAVIKDLPCQQHSASNLSSTQDNNSSSCAPDAAAPASCKDQENDKDIPEVNIGEKGCEYRASNSSSGANSMKQQCELKSVSIIENVQTLSASPLSTGTTGKRSSPNRTREQRNKKTSNSPSNSPSKQQEIVATDDGGSSSSTKISSSKGKHHQQSSSTCQKSGGPSAASTEGKTVNHKDAASGSATGGASGSSQKIILDLDDKSRFTEEITV